MDAHSQAVFITVEHRGTQHGQDDYALLLKVDGLCVGYLNYSVMDGIPAIHMIEVATDYRRCGYATALLQFLQAAYPDREISMGMLTDQGAKWLNSVPMRRVPNPDAISGRAELAMAKDQRDELLRRPRRSVDEFLVINELHDRVADLERDWMHERCFRRLVCDQPSITIEDREKMNTEIDKVATPEGMAFEVVNYQDKGYYGRIHFQLDGRDEVATVPRPNLVLADMYQTAADTLKACEERAATMKYLAKEGDGRGVESSWRAIIARNEAEAMIEARRIVDSSDIQGHWVALPLPETEGLFRARRNEQGQVICFTDFDDSTRGMSTEYLRKLFFPSTSRDQLEAQRVMDEFLTKAKVTDGIVRWRSNDQIPPQAVLDIWEFAGHPFDADLSTKTRESEVGRFLTEYRALHAGRRPSSEQFAEMRSAMGEDATVVNVVTGDRYDLASETVVRAAPRMKP